MRMKTQKQRQTVEKPTLFWYFSFERRRQNVSYELQSFKRYSTENPEYLFKSFSQKIQSRRFGKGIKCIFKFDLRELDDQSEKLSSSYLRVRGYRILKNEHLRGNELEMKKYFQQLFLNEIRYQREKFHSANAQAFSRRLLLKRFGNLKFLISKMLKMSFFTH